MFSEPRTSKIILRRHTPSPDFPSLDWLRLVLVHNEAGNRHDVDVVAKSSSNSNSALFSARLRLFSDFRPEGNMSICLAVFKPKYILARHTGSGGVI